MVLGHHRRGDPPVAPPAQRGEVTRVGVRLLQVGRGHPAVAHVHDHGGVEVLGLEQVLLVEFLGGLGRRRQVGRRVVLLRALQLARQAPEGGDHQDPEARPPGTSSGGRIRTRSGGFRLIAAGPVVSPWPRRLRGPRTPEPVSSSCPDPAHYGAPPWSRVPRRPPHVWKDPDILLKEYDVSHRLSVSSYISIFRSLFGTSCAAVPVCRTPGASFPGRPARHDPRRPLPGWPPAHGAGEHHPQPPAGRRNRRRRERRSRGLTPRSRTPPEMSSPVGIMTEPGNHRHPSEQPAAANPGPSTQNSRYILTGHSTQDTSYYYASSVCTERHQEASCIRKSPRPWSRSTAMSSCGTRRRATGPAGAGSPGGTSAGPGPCWPRPSRRARRARTAPAMAGRRGSSLVIIISAHRSA